MKTCSGANSPISRPCRGPSQPLALTEVAVKVTTSHHRSSEPFQVMDVSRAGPNMPHHFLDVALGQTVLLQPLYPKSARL